MADDLGQQLTQNAPTIGGAGGLLFAVIAALKMFVTQKDVDIAKAQVLAEVAEKYAHKDDLTQMRADITYIRGRIDEAVDRQHG